MNILCFGDSNTWGLRPMIGDRYIKSERWTGRLQNMLGNGHYVIEEGLNGRTANEIDIEEPYLNGREYMTACLLSHRPVDVLIVMLGSNDIKSRYNKTAEQVAESILSLTKDMKKLLDERQSEDARVLLISPKSIDERILGDWCFTDESIANSKRLGGLLKEGAAKENWSFIDADEAGVTLGDDGLHLSPEGHEVLAKAVYEAVARNLYQHRTSMNHTK